MQAAGELRHRGDTPLTSMLRQARKNAESNDISMGLRLQLLTQFGTRTLTADTYLPPAPVRTPLVYDSRTATVTTTVVTLVSANGLLSRSPFLRSAGKSLEFHASHPVKGSSYPRKVMLPWPGMASAIFLAALRLRFHIVYSRRRVTINLKTR